MKRVHNDWLPVEAEAHQSWPPKNKKETDKLTNRERQKKEKKQKNAINSVKALKEDRVLRIRIQCHQVHPTTLTIIQQICSIKNT